MPIYEYRCSACGHEREVLQKVSAAPLVDCPECGRDTMVKLISAAGFQLKGSGWYATDFRGSGSKPAATEGKGANGESKAEAKTEAKSEPKTGESAGGHGCGAGSCSCH